MDTKVRKRIFWGVLSLPVVSGIFFLLGGTNAFAAGPHGYGPGGMGRRGGFSGGHGMYGAVHSGAGFNWLGFLVFLAIFITGVVLLVKWLRKKSKTSSMQQFIDPSLMSSHTPTMSQNASMLDQWEKTIINKKENE